MKQLVKKKIIIAILAVSTPIFFGILGAETLSAPSQIYKLNNNSGILPVTQNILENANQEQITGIFYIIIEENLISSNTLVTLNELAKKYNKIIYFYDAQEDLVSSCNNTTSLLQKYSTNKTHFAIIFKDGVVVHTIENKSFEMAKEIRAYFKDENYYQKLHSTVLPTNFLNIDLEQLQNFRDGIYYIGRKDCNSCKNFTPVIENLSEMYNVEIMYYDTAQDRNENYSELMDVLELYNIKTVPSIVVIENMEVVELISGDDIAQKASEYFSVHFNETMNND